MLEGISLRNGFAACILFLVSNIIGATTNSNHVAFIEALYWQMRQGGDENWAQILTPATSPQSVEVQGVAFKWQPGLRFGMGTKLPHDQWDLLFYYTRYQTKCTDSISTTAGGVFSSFLGNFFVNNTDGGSISNAAHYRSANLKWKFFFNTIDLELGRKFTIDQNLFFRPFIGLKCGIINQHIFTKWNNPINVSNFTAATEDLKNDFVGIGPTLGFESKLRVYNSTASTLHILGNISGGLLWGHWSFSDVYQNSAPLSVTVLTRDINGGCTMTRALLGVEWGKRFNNSSVGVRLGYEIQAWFDQVQYYSYNTGRLNEPTYLQGGVLGIYCNF